MLSSHHILLLGATGVSGLALIQEALALQHPPKLTLYVRTPSKLPLGINTHSNITVVEGVLSDESALSKAMEGVDTVISLLGVYFSLSAMFWRTKSTPLADELKTVLKVMKAKGIRNILALSTPSFYVYPETHSLSVTLYQIFPPIFLPQGTAEMIAIAKTITAEDDLDWTIFRIPSLTMGSPDLPVCAGLLGPEWKGKLEISRGSMVRWLLKEVEERKWVRGAPVIGNY